MDARGNGCDVCRARAGSPEAILADDVENWALIIISASHIMMSLVAAVVQYITRLQGGHESPTMAFRFIRMITIFQMRFWKPTYY